VYGDKWVLELFSGTGSFSKAAGDRGYRTFTVDNDQKHEPDGCQNVMNIEARDVIDTIGVPFIIWASPPCTCFSVASLRYYWNNGLPKTKETRDAIKLVIHTVNLIRKLNPDYFIIENPRGMMRKIAPLKLFKRTTITYSSYGHPHQKPTDLWHNIFQWIPRKKENGNIPHTLGTRSPIKRAIVPRELCDDILDAIEGKQRVKQTQLDGWGGR
jgi:hypothetical protein